MSSDWVETKAILSEVEQLFNRDDDIRYIYDVKKMAKEIDDHCLSYLSETKDIIKSKVLLLICCNEVLDMESYVIFIINRVDEQDCGQRIWDHGTIRGRRKILTLDVVQLI